VGISRAEQSLDIAAPPDACYEAIVDFETYPEWQRAVIGTEVLERHADGLGKLVRLTVDAKLRRVVYTLHYHHDRPHRLWWDFVEGDGVAYIDGEYLFEPLGDDRTRATYRLGVDAGVPMPGFIAKRLNEEVMRRSIEDTRAEVERRASGSA
jgi:ribosome-associated toxin RatA of RatAB toxin-antitoxin module